MSHAEVCERIAPGHFIHHNPDGGEDLDPVKLGQCRAWCSLGQVRAFLCSIPRAIASGTAQSASASNPFMSQVPRP